MKPFGRTLVVKLLGRQPSYGFMVKKLRQIWARKCINGGPWLINDAYLNVARWRPEFNPKSAIIESVVAWVRFPDLPAPLFDKKFLLNLGNVIGKAIKLDIHTAQRARGKFARMCVELDLTKPLVPEFEIEGQVLSIVYESLGMLCNKCGRFGHSREVCEELQKRDMEERMEVENLGYKKDATVHTETKIDLWKTMQRPRRPRRVPVPDQNQQRGSRFSVLEGEVGSEGELLRGEGAPETLRAEGSKGKEQVQEVVSAHRMQGKSGGPSEGGKGAGVQKTKRAEC
ncbi:hypothetical protein K1719_024033 [Acacia pycnantha]|nr:hypothetical protein K1719_024033 [Acacia pycnantha]